MTKVCLQPDELVEITGYRQKSKQLKWLKFNKVPHKVNAMGKPVVSRAKWDESHGKAVRSKLSQPNWGTS